MDVITSQQNENSGGNSLKSKKSSVGKSLHGRNTLAVLQATENTGGLTRHDPNKQKKGKKISQKKNFQIFEDVKKTTAKQEEKKSECIHMEVQTESENCCHCMCHEDEEKEKLAAEEEARRLMVDDDVPEDYWQQLAESRREALEESLIENEILHTEMEELKEENRRLSELAEHAEYFANILKSMNTEEETDQVFNNPIPPTSQARDLKGNQSESEENIIREQTENVDDNNEKESHPEEES